MKVKAIGDDIETAKDVSVVVWSKMNGCISATLVPKGLSINMIILLFIEFHLINLKKKHELTYEHVIFFILFF